MAFTSISLKSSNNYLGIVTNCMSRNDNIGDLISGSLFVPSQVSVKELSEHWPPSISGSEKNELDIVWKRQLSRFTIPTKSGASLLSLPLSKMILFPITSSRDVDKEFRDLVIKSFFDFDDRFYDGPIAIIDNARYLSLKDQTIMKFPKVISFYERAISSLGDWLVTGGAFVFLIHLRKDMSYCERGLPNKMACHLSSPFLADIEKKGRRLVLHRFASTSHFCKPNNFIIMAIDKARGYLVYTGFGHLNSYSYFWVVLDSMTNYTSGDLLYFNKDGCFYVLPNAECGDIEIWRLQYDIFSKKSLIDATFMDGERDKYYNHIHAYLVESLNGDLLLVRRYVASVFDAGIDFRTNCFEVFKLNFELKQWEVVSSLGEEAIFVGSNNSFSLSSTKYAEVIPNCIYFTDQVCHHQGRHMLHGNDNGIFHLEDCTFTTLFNSDFKCRLAPVWLRPYERP